MCRLSILTEACKNHARKGIAQKPFSHCSNDHEQSAKEHVCRYVRRARTSCTSPAHQDTTQGRETEEEADECTFYMLIVFIASQLRFMLTLELGYRMSFVGRQRLCSVGRGRAFSNISGEIEMLPAVLILFKAAPCSMLSSMWKAPSLKSFSRGAPCPASLWCDILEVLTQLMGRMV